MHEIGQSLLHGLCAGRWPAVEIAMPAYGAGAEPVSTLHQAVAERNDGALPVARGANEGEGVRWYWHVQTPAFGCCKLCRRGTTACVATAVSAIGMFNRLYGL